MKKITGCIALMLLAVSVVCEAAAYSMPLRLHVVANSSSAADQSVKLLVRDGVLGLSDELFAGAMSLEDAKKTAAENKGLFKECADRILRENGFSYTADVETGTFYFPEKDYGSIIYPEGEYEALRVVLGDGEGENWWCVMYPSLCVYSRGTGRKRVIKSAILEWIRRRL